MSIEAERLKASIRHLARDGCLALTAYCRQRLNERNVHADDVLNVLTWGDLVEHEAGRRKHEHRCTLRGMSIDGESLTIVVIFREDDHRLVCVTVHG